MCGNESVMKCPSSQILVTAQGMRDIERAAIVPLLLEQGADVQV